MTEVPDPWWTAERIPAAAVRETLHEIAFQLLNLAATSDALPGLLADISEPVETDGTSVWFLARTQSGTPVRITLKPLRP